MNFLSQNFKISIKKTFFKFLVRNSTHSSSKLLKGTQPMKRDNQEILKEGMVNQHIFYKGILTKIYNSLPTGTLHLKRCLCKNSETKDDRGLQNTSENSSFSGDNFNSHNKPFETIPGPKGLPLLGNAFFFPKTGLNSLEDFWGFCQMLYNTYGPIVRISKVSPNLNILYLFDPEDIKKLFQNEGSLPERPKQDILYYYRIMKKDFYSSGGLVTENGVKWKKLRRAVPSLLNFKIISSYQKRQAAITDELIKAISYLQNESAEDLSGKTSSQIGYIEDILPLLFRYTLEAVGVVSMGMNFGCLKIENLHSDSKNTSLASRIIRSNEDTLNAMYKSVFSLPLYRFFPTKTYNQLRRAQDLLTSIAEKELKRLEKDFICEETLFREKDPFIASLFENKELDRKEVLLLLVEILQGGIDATATTLAFALYFLAGDKSTQEVLFQEISDIDSSTHSLQNLPVLKAVLKETFRLRPSATAVGRILPDDVTLRGFHVPKGTLVQGPPLISCRNSESFPEPNTFNPFRWIKEPIRSGCNLLSPLQKEGNQPKESPKTEVRDEIHPYSVLPFGHGARMCPGRRLAEQEIYLALIKITQNYHMQLVAPDSDSQRNCADKLRLTQIDSYIGQKMRLNMMPARNISIKFTRRC